MLCCYRCSILLREGRAGRILAPEPHLAPVPSTHTPLTRFHSGRSSSSDLCLAALAACTAAVPPDHPIFDAASKAAPSDAADVTRLLTAIVRVHICAVLLHFTRIKLHACQHDSSFSRLSAGASPRGSARGQEDQGVAAAAAASRQRKSTRAARAGARLALILLLLWFSLLPS
jgi:hypothetical protein